MPAVLPQAFPIPAGRETNGQQAGVVRKRA
jgi:hypothetical protein